MKHLSIIIGVIAVSMAFFSAGEAWGQNYPFNECGFLMEGDSGCVFFIPQEGDSGNLFILENYGGFHAGDEVCVSGTIEVGCESACEDVYLCVINNTIDDAGMTDYPFNASGVLVDSNSCLLFSSLWDSALLLKLDDYGTFHAGDTVFVSGMLSDDCPGICPEAIACLKNNTIEGDVQPPIPMAGMVVVGLIPGATPNNILPGYNISIVDSITEQNMYLINFSDSLPIQNIIMVLNNDPRVLFAEPNFEFGLPENLQMSMSFPDENRPPLILGSSPPGYYEQGAKYTIGIDSAQKLATGENITIAVIDNGVDFTHPLFTDLFLSNGYDFLDNDSDPTYDTGSAASHGTFVSGLIALTAPGCRILPIRAFNGNGVGNNFSIAEAIYYAVDAGVDIINMSFGMQEYNKVVETACSTAVAAGIILVAAGGNDGSISAVYPAAYDNVIAVSAVDSNDVLAPFSNFGTYMDICAPGVSLYSSLAGEYNWGTWSGTSFSAALVSATCALVKEVEPDLTPENMEDHLRITAQKVLHEDTLSVPDFYYGYGRLDAANAVWVLKPAGLVCGDANSDGGVNVSDVVFLVNYIFHGGAAPDESASADANCDGTINIGDAVYLLDYIFKLGDSPCCR